LLSYLVDDNQAKQWDITRNPVTPDVVELLIFFGKLVRGAFVINKFSAAGHAPPKSFARVILSVPQGVIQRPLGRTSWLAIFLVGVSSD
jgi:hypothetical protein